MKTLIAGSNGVTSVLCGRGGWFRDWQRWASYVAVVWPLVYAILSAYCAVSDRGFPYTPETMSHGLGPLLGRFGLGVGWIVVTMAGIPAVAMGAALSAVTVGYYYRRRGPCSVCGRGISIEVGKPSSR